MFCWYQFLSLFVSACDQLNPRWVRSWNAQLNPRLAYPSSQRLREASQAMGPPKQMVQFWQEGNQHFEGNWYSLAIPLLHDTILIYSSSSIISKDQRGEVDVMFGLVWFLLLHCFSNMQHQSWLDLANVFVVEKWLGGGYAVDQGRRQTSQKRQSIFT